MNLGKIGENLVAGIYREDGYEIIGQNVRLYAVKQLGEFDVVAARGKELVFVEVKTRRSYSYGFPAEAVTYSKKRKLVRSAKLFMLTHPQYDGFDWRIDVAEVDIDNSEKPAIIHANAIEDY